MPKQPAFPSMKHAIRKKRTRREQFLAEMDGVVPWGRLLALIEPHYPKAGPKVGRPPMPLETMLRIYFLQNWYALSDPTAEEMLYDSDAMRHFAGSELGDDRIPDETTILNFRHLLERHGLTEALFAEVNGHLADKGITLRSGTLVDATIIDAPSSTKNEAMSRGPKMSSTKKGNTWYFGIKAHIGVDADSGVVHSLDTSTEKLHDSRVRDDLLHGGETSVWADKGCVNAEREAEISGQDRIWGVMRKAPKKTAPQSKSQHKRRFMQRSLPWTRQEPGPALHSVHARQPLPGPTKVDGIRRTLSEAGHGAERAAPIPAIRDAPKRSGQIFGAADRVVQAFLYPPNQHPAARHAVAVRDKEAFICERDQASCTAATPDGSKVFYDYGHFTLEGAAYFGMRIAEIEWLDSAAP